jgi:hypothetical protein
MPVEKQASRWFEETWRYNRTPRAPATDALRVKHVASMGPDEVADVEHRTVGPQDNGSLGDLRRAIEKRRRDPPANPETQSRGAPPP